MFAPAALKVTVKVKKFWSALSVSTLILVGALPLAASASPMVVAVGVAHATLTLTPDPPQTGQISAIVSLSGVSASTLAATKASFSSMMPTMSMAGPSGAPTQLAPGEWTFTFSSATATTWNLALHFSGGLNGTATFRFAVGGVDGGSGQSSMAGMSATSGDPGAWMWAAFALSIILAAVIVVVVLRKDRRPLTLAIVVGAAAVVIAFAVIQSRFASPPMDMAAMSNIQGSAPVPVTLAAVRFSRMATDIHAPGTIAPYLTQDIVTRAPGILTNFTLYAGDRVARGQVIAVLDAPDLQSRALAAVADARGQAAAAEAADIEAHHHAPNGITIARADTRALQSNLAAAESDRSAKAERERYWQGEVAREKMLVDQGAVSVQEYQDERAQAAGARSALAAANDSVAALRQQIIISRTKASDAVATVEQMQAQAVSAQAQAAKAAAQAATDTTFADYRTVTSPDDAIMVKRLVDPGVYVQPGTVIARIAVIRRLRIEANVAQQDVASVSVGAPIDATLQDGRVLHGRVSSLSPIADATTHTATVEAIVDNERADIVPGGFVQVLIHARSRGSLAGTLVPSVAIIGDGSDAAVWTDVNGTAHRVPVHVLADDGTTATVTGSLDRKARVVTDGAATLEEGQPIADSRA